MCRVLRLSRPEVYRMVDPKRLRPAHLGLRTFKVGRRRLALRSDLVRLLRTLAESGN